MSDNVVLGHDILLGRNTVLTGSTVMANPCLSDFSKPSKPFGNFFEEKNQALEARVKELESQLAYSLIMINGFRDAIKEINQENNELISLRDVQKEQLKAAERTISLYLDERNVLRQKNAELQAQVENKTQQMADDDPFPPEYKNGREIKYL